MANLDKNRIIEIVENGIKHIDDKNFNIYFYVLDTEGYPSGSLEYIYQTALILKNNGYNVIMLHNQKDFVGVTGWHGEKYSVLEHKEIKKGSNLEVNAWDFLFIPEIFADVMAQTKNLPCKRVAIVQNYNYLPEYIPIGASFSTLKINDAITNTKVQEDILHEYFPRLNTYVVSPSISKIFRNTDEPKNLMVNIISRNQENVRRIMKTFYWKHPEYQWVSFSELRGFDHETLSEGLRKSPFTVWVDETTNFGFAALEAMKCGSIVLAKIPNTPSDWNYEINKDGEKTFTDACIWFDSLDDVPDMLATLVYNWMTDNIPEKIYENTHKFDNLYTPETQEKEVLFTYNEIFSKRKKHFEETLAQIKNKNEE